MNRHRFEPARLLLGLLLVGAALTYVMDALGEWRVPVWVLLVLVPASLLTAVCTAGVTFAARRLLLRRQGVRPGPGPGPGSVSDSASASVEDVPARSSPSA